jgi:hypothetical protein
MPIACKMCIAEKGLKGSEIDQLPKTDEELIDHIESEHHIAVKREGESEEKAHERLIAKYPEANDTKTCKCPSCKANREAFSKLRHLSN